MSQFHYGSIKTIAEMYWYKIEEVYRLNSTMVRLKQQRLGVQITATIGLNSTMVRLKQSAFLYRHGVTNGTSQFHYGSIKTC